MRTRWSAFDTLAALAVAVLFAALVAHHAFMGDDAYICFRYARNLVDGHGLVYNPGWEPVEGYTTFLWVVLLAGAMQLGLAPEGPAQALGIASGAGVLALLALFARRRARDASEARWAWAAPLALALDRTFTGWCTGGLETMLYALLVWSAALAFLRGRERRTSTLPAGILFGLAQLTRPSAALLGGVAGALALWDVARRRRPLRHALGLAAGFAAVAVPHLLWRRSYYGDWVPNTYHAKVSGMWLEQSSVYAWLYARDHGLLLWLPLAGWGLVRRARRGDLDGAHALLLATCAAHVTFLLYVGGDRFEYRFFTPVLAPLWWLLAEGVRGALDGLPRAARRAAGPLAAAGLAASGLASTLLGFEPTSGITSLERIAEVADKGRREGLYLRELVRDGYLRGDELLGVQGAGALPWFSELPALDLHGLNDREIARLPVDERGLIAHEKLATPEIVRERGVVICETRSQLVFDEIPDWIDSPLDRPYYSGPVRCVKAKGRVLVFFCTLPEGEYLRRFARFGIYK